MDREVPWEDHEVVRGGDGTACGIQEVAHSSVEEVVRSYQRTEGAGRNLVVYLALVQAEMASEGHLLLEVVQGKLEAGEGLDDAGFLQGLEVEPLV